MITQKQAEKIAEDVSSEAVAIANNDEAHAIFEKSDAYFADFGAAIYNAVMDNLSPFVSGEKGGE